MESKMDSMTLGELKQITAMLKGGTHKEQSHFEVGKSYFIRTVTHHYTGRVVRVTAKELVLSDAAWIADDGKFSEMFVTGKPAEVEPFLDDVVLNREAILDGSFWRHPLPRQVV